VIIINLACHLNLTISLKLHCHVMWSSSATLLQDCDARTQNDSFTQPSAYLDFLAKFLERYNTYEVDICNLSLLSTVFCVWSKVLFSVWPTLAFRTFRPVTRLSSVWAITTQQVWLSVANNNRVGMALCRLTFRQSCSFSVLLCMVKV